MADSRHDTSERRGAKTEAIRTVIADHPDWGAKQICEQVNGQGLRVSLQMAYKVLKTVESLRTTDAEPVKIENLNLQEVLEFKVRVVDPFGGLAKVEALVRALKMLQSPPPMPSEEPTAPESGDEETKPKQKNYRSIDDP